MFKRFFLATLSVFFLATVNVSFAALSFTSGDSLTTSAGAGADMIAADVDGVNGDDLIVAKGTVLELFLNNGDGSFAAASGIATSGSTLDKLCVFDADGINGNDIIASDATNDDLVVFLNDGSQSFSATTYSAGTNPFNIACGDVDGDTDIDVVLVGDELYVAFNDGDGTFDTSVVTYDVADPVNSQPLLLDMDGGQPEILLGTAGAGGGGYESLAVFANDNSGGFTVHDGSGGALAYDYVLAAGQTPMQSAVISDVDGLLGDDVVFISQTNSEVSVLLNDGAGGVTTPSDDYVVGTFPEAVITADIDNINGPDLVVVDSSDLVFEVFLNNGDGTFAAGQTFATDNNTSDLVSIDVDGDGLNDVVTSDVGSGELVIHLNTTDLVPDDFEFVDELNAPVSTLMPSVDDPVTITGIGAGVPISIVGGMYNINGGGYTSAAGIVYSGDIVRVQHTSAATESTITNSIVTIGGVSDTFTSITDSPADTFPEPFYFNSIYNVEPSTLYTSNSQIIRRIDASAPISVSNGEYRLGQSDVGPFTSEAGFANHRDRVRVRGTSSSSYNTTKVVTLNVGGRLVTFSMTTKQDIDPDPFNFSDVGDVELSTLTESASVNISGLGVSATISVTGGEYEVGGSGTWLTTPGTVGPADTTVKVRTTSSSKFDSDVNATLRVGDYSDTFTVTTKLDDIISNNFKFNDVFGAQPNTVVESNYVYVRGIDAPASINITGPGGSNPEYSINDGPWITGASTVGDDNRIKVRGTSAAYGGSVDIVLTVSDKSDTFTITTTEDFFPDSFAFTTGNLTNVSLSTAYVDDTTITGLGAAAPISISGGEYSLVSNTGPWTTAPGTVNNQQVWVRVVSSSSFNRSKTLSLTVGDQSADLTVTTEKDFIANSFSFTDVNDAPRFSTITSNFTYIRGISANTDITIEPATTAANAEYSINGGAWTSVDGVDTVPPNARVRVRGDSDDYGSSRQVVITIGGHTDIFTINATEDIFPDAFAGDFVDLSDQNRSTLLSSNTIQITGLTSGSGPISVSGGEYELNTSGAWTSAAGTINNNDFVTVRTTSSSSFSKRKDVVLTIGDQSDTFSVTTGPDNLPNAFAFNDATNVDPNAVIVSNLIRVRGIAQGVGVAASVAGSATNPQYRVNRGAWTSAAGTVYLGDTIEVRGESGAHSSSVNVVMTLGDKSDSFDITAIDDIYPDAFDLGANVSGALRSSVHVSALDTISGLGTAAPISVSGGQYRIDGGAWQTAASTINNGQDVEVQGTASSSFNSTVNVTLTIGNQSDTFSITTELDNEANSFSFNTVNNAPINTLITSSYSYIRGIKTNADITIEAATTAANAEYSINGGAWSNASLAAVVPPNARIRVRGESGAYGSSETVVLTVGGHTAVFTINATEDVFPNSFAGGLGSLVDQPISTVLESNTVNITGLGFGSGTISVSGGQYELNNSDTWLSGSGTINEGDDVVVRATSSSLYNKTTEVVLTIGDQSDVFRITTEKDNQPNAFAFSDAVDVDPNTLIPSDLIRVRGIAVGVGIPVSINGGGTSAAVAEYRINRGAWVSAPGTVYLGDILEVRGESGAHNASVTVQLDVGDKSDTFNITSIEDIYPDAFDLGADVSDVPVSSIQQSATIQITGLAAAAPVSVSGGEYSIGAAPGVWNTASGTINNNEFITVRGVSSSSFDRTTSVTLTIGNQSDTFNITTELDSLANPFYFTDVSNADINTLVTSNYVYIRGIRTYADIEIDAATTANNPQYSINDGAWNNATQLSAVAPNSRIRVRGESGGYGSSETVVLTVGGHTDIFTIDATEDVFPNAFTFTDEVDQPVSTVVESGPVNITGMSFGSGTISVSGGQYELNNSGTWLSGSGPITEGDDVAVRTTSSAQYNKTVNVDVTIGDKSDTFSVTTERDTYPDAFVLSDVSDVDPNTVVASDFIRVLGIDNSVGVAISVAGTATNPQYRINRGSWTSAPGTVYLRDVVEVRGESGAHSANVNVALTIGDKSDNFDINSIDDIYPVPFDLGANVNNVARSSVQVSSPPATISGLAAAAPISVTGGQYRIDGGAWTSAAGTINDGQDVEVQGTASSDFNRTVDVVLTIGNQSDVFGITTELDNEANPFSFTDVNNAPINTVIESNFSYIRGTDANADIAIEAASTAANPEFSINGGAWQTGSVADAVPPNARIKVRGESGGYGSSETVVVTVGGHTEIFTINATEDVFPNAFAGSFVDEVDQPLSTIVESNAINITGLGFGSGTVTVSGGQYELNNSGTWLSGSGPISEGDDIAVRTTSSSQYNKTVDVVLTIGDQSDTFSVTTQLDDVPNAFAFDDAVDVDPATMAVSNLVRVRGIDLGVGVPVSINGGGTSAGVAEYRINRGAWVSAPGTVYLGDTLEVRGEAGAHSASVTVQLDVADKSDVFNITSIDDIYPTPFDLGADVTNVARSSVQQSATIVISGIASPAPVSITGGEYSIGAVPAIFTPLPGTINNGESITVAGIASSKFDKTTEVVLTIGNQSDTFRITTELDDLANAFSFNDVNNVPINTLTESNYTYIRGTDTNADITLEAATTAANAAFSINDGPWQSGSLADAVPPNARIKVRGDSGGYASTETVVLTVGGYTATFNINATPDIFPVDFAGDFIDAVDQTRSDIVVSNSIVITGLDSGSGPISVTGGAYQINGAGPWTGANGTINDGDSVAVRGVASPYFSKTVDVVLTIGDKSDTFSITTEPDNLPNPISFVDVSDVDPGETIISNVVRVRDVEAGLPIPVSLGAGTTAGNASYRVNRGAWTAAPGNAFLADTIEVRGDAGAHSASVDVVLDLGNQSDTFTINTIDDIYPAPFDLGLPVTNVARSSVHVSALDTINMITDPAPISVSGGQYRIDGGAWVSADGTITNGQTVEVQGTASPDFNKTTSVTLTIGNQSDTFSITTELDNEANAFSFNDANDVNINTLITSNYSYIRGTDTNVDIQIDGATTAANAEYSINDGPWTNAVGIGAVPENARIRVRGESGGYATNRTVVLTVGGYTGTFNINATPDVFSDPLPPFVDQVDVSRSVTVVSNSITVTGLGAGYGYVWIKGGEYEINNSGVWLNTKGTINDNDQIRVRGASSWLFSKTVDVELTVGIETETFSITTEPDNLPNTFAFNDLVDVPRNSVVESNVVRVRGIEDGVGLTVSVAGSAGSPEYRVNRGTWTSAPGTVYLADAIEVRGVSGDYHAVRDVTLTVGPESDTFTMTSIGDIYPDPFVGSFVDQTDLTRNTLYTSNTIAISNTDTPAPISISGGEYSVSSAPGVWTSSPGLLPVGDSVTVRGYSSSKFNKTVDIVLTIADQSDAFSLTTELDNLANDFWFNSADRAPINSVIESGYAYIRGTDTAVDIAIDGASTAINPEYSVNDGPWTSAPGIGAVPENARIKVRGESAGYATTRTVVVNVGGQSANFTINATPDVFPDSFAGQFVDVVDAARSSLVVSNAITPVNYLSPAEVSIKGGEYEISSSPGVWRSSNGLISPTESITVRGVASPIFNTAKNVELTIGGETDTFTITTEPDNIPAPFAFISVNDAPLSTVVYSNERAITGLGTAVPISITSDADGEYSINGGPWMGELDPPSMISNGDRVRVRITSSADYSIFGPPAAPETVNATLTVGAASSESGTFSVTTINDQYPDAFEFEHLKNAARESLVESIPIEITGIEGPAPIKLRGLKEPMYRISADGGATWSTYSEGPGWINNGNYLQVRILSSNTYLGYREVDVTIGDQTAVFAAQTEARPKQSAFGGDGDPMFQNRKVKPDDGKRDFFLGAWSYLSVLALMVIALRRRRL